MLLGLGSRIFNSVFHILDQIFQRSDVIGLGQTVNFWKAEVVQPGLDVPEECLDSVSVLLSSRIVPQWHFPSGIEVIYRMVYGLNRRVNVRQIVFVEILTVEWYIRLRRRHEVKCFHLDPQLS